MRSVDNVGSTKIEVNITIYFMKLKAYNKKKLKKNWSIIVKRLY